MSFFSDGVWPQYRYRFILVLIIIGTPQEGTPKLGEPPYEVTSCSGQRCYSYLEGRGDLVIGISEVIR